jgi:oligo-1,6-glucosidase
VNPNYTTVNAESSVTDERSVWNHYRQLIALRKNHAVIVYGTYQSWLDQHPDVMVYSRILDEERLVVIANFSGRDVELTIPNELKTTGRCLISNYNPVEQLDGVVTLRPYEAFAILGSTAIPTEAL